MYLLGLAVCAMFHTSSLWSPQVPFMSDSHLTMHRLNEGVCPLGIEYGHLYVALRAGHACRVASSYRGQRFLTQTLEQSPRSQLLHTHTSAFCLSASASAIPIPHPQPLIS